MIGGRCVYRGGRAGQCPDSAAAAPMAAELREELGLVEQLADESVYGDATRAAKMCSADAALKSRTRGRRR